MIKGYYRYIKITLRSAIKCGSSKVQKDHNYSEIGFIRIETTRVWTYGMKRVKKSEGWPVKLIV